MSRENVIVKPHFLYILNLLYPYLTLLIIPAIRSAVQYVFFKSQVLSQFLILELTVLLLAVAMSVIKFKKYTVCFGERITVKKGLFCPTEYTLEFDVSRVMVIESNPLLRVLGVFRLKIYTEAGRRHRPDESVLIGVKDAKKLYDMNLVKGQSVRSNTYGEVVMSAALSSSATGILISIPIVKLSFSLLGKSVPSLLPKINSDTLKGVDFASLGQYITVLLIVGYIVSFFVLFFRNFGFSSARENRKIVLQSGKLPRRTVFLDSDSIKAVKFVTAPIMFFAKKCAVKFSSCGYGLRKGEIGLLIPSVKPSIAKGLTKWLLPNFATEFCGVKPPKKAIKRCLKPPFGILSMVLLGVVAVERIYPQIAKPLLPVFLGAGLIVAVWTVMRVFSFFKSGIAFDEHHVKLKCSKGFQFLELYGLKPEIYCIKISATPFDRLHSQCSVTVRFFGKNKDTAKVKYIETECFKSYFEKCYRHL